MALETTLNRRGKSMIQNKKDRRGSAVDRFAWALLASGTAWMVFQVFIRPEIGRIINELSH